MEIIIKHEIESHKELLELIASYREKVESLQMEGEDWSSLNFGFGEISTEVLVKVAKGLQIEPLNGIDNITMETINEEINRRKEN